MPGLYLAGRDKPLEFLKPIQHEPKVCGERLSVIDDQGKIIISGVFPWPSRSIA